MSDEKPPTADELRERETTLRAELRDTKRVLNDPASTDLDRQAAYDTRRVLTRQLTDVRKRLMRLEMVVP